MQLFKLISTEFSKLAANKGILFSVIAALLVPVLYGGILLSATWGPYDNLSNLPVAVVNEDQGAVSENESINVGSELVMNLKEGKNLGWKFVNSADAMRGLEQNEYYMAIIIPKDFSQRVTTVMEPDPQKLELEYIQNEGLNFLASKVTETASQRIREQLANTITENYTSKVFSSLGDVSEGFEKAADGSARLSDGTGQLNEGTEKLLNSVTTKQSDITRLADGSQQLKDGTSLLLEKLQGKSSDISKLADGSERLHDGTVTLKDGTGKLLNGLQKAETGSEELKNGVATNLAPGARKVADGTIRLKGGSAELAAGAEKLVAGLEEFGAKNPSTQVPPYDESYQKIIDGAKKISNGLNSLSSKSVKLSDGAVTVADGIDNKVVPGTAKLHDGLNQLVEGQQKIDNGAAKLEDGAQKVADGNGKVETGWNELITGVSKLDTGAGKIADGNEAVDEGWKKLSTGAEKLNNGAGKVNDGSEKLASGLKEGAEKTSGIETGDDNAGMFSSPVKLKSKSVNEYEHYRDSTAPYVLTLGLFVGILIMSLFIKFKRPAHTSSIDWFITKFLKLSSLAVVQAILLMLVVLFVLGVNVTNPIGLVFFAIVVSIVFSAIVLFLASLGGNIGRFLAIGFVILQLSITGANLPIEMLPNFHRSLSEFLPFTYSIAGFKSVITLNDLGGMITNMSILLTYLIIFAGLSYVVFLFKKQKAHKSKDADVVSM
ncbi:YhgE/Pip domain-containing protein [Pseudalkalibacillus berkeleyi]|uniref:YhgE/Pip domain-containing protein n=1 Tax=Pseudalkalibacillus berkeleyi TaxID=1069813 RepID=A0ABS9H3K7_9BACL|nr:YhgE/Pip domain-containing protein [Pseudalkalibacillus berkeleyi]MCF6138494.1 YhgE/Pip domain-containing protein [Pseudalkalibacillus berkeleyi]